MKEEPVDIMDEQGNKTGQVLLKSEAHRRGLWHGGAHIWIYNSDGEVLLQLRSPKKIVEPNIWDLSVAGHIQAGKTPLETVVEEAQEELSLKVDPKKLKFIGAVKIHGIMPPDDWDHRVHLWIYALRQDNLKLSSLVLEKDEARAVKWLPLKQLQKDLANPAKAHLYSTTPASYNIAIAQIPKLLAKDKN